MKRTTRALPLVSILAALIGGALIGCESSPKPPVSSDEAGFSAPSEHTIKANQKFKKTLPKGLHGGVDEVNRGFIATRKDPLIKSSDGKTVWDLDQYQFIKGDAPDSVNPSLWRQASLNNIHGLFKVTDRLYQVRGFDLANMSIIIGDDGWIVVDPLTAEETAVAAMELAREHLGGAPVKAIIITHSHLDHFGGVWGAIDKAQLASGEVQIIAPEGFVEEATSENIIAGVAMGRRASFMYGRNLPVDKRGHVDSGLGKTPAYGTLGLAVPTDIIDETGQKMTISGLEFIFQNAPSSEAPAELTFSIPELEVYCGAEVGTRTLHNLYTLRGAKVRDALKWSAYIDEMIHLSEGTDIYFASHHWPVWGRDNVVNYLERQRDTYKYIHDQTVRLFNNGLTSKEIAEQLVLPSALQQGYANRDYYGTLSHNSKAVYQSYLGWYDANPANLNPLPPVQSGKRYVELAGGAEAIIANAKAAIAEGDYRWAAEILNHLVFAQPDNSDAKELLAKAYEQMAYQAESAPWRDVYLSAAYELRTELPPEPVVKMADMLGIMELTPVEKFFQTLSVRLDSDEAEGVDKKIAIIFTDMDKAYLLKVKNSVMHHQASPSPEELETADATLILTRDVLLRILVGEVGLKEVLTSDELEVKGSVIDLLSFFSMFESPQGDFHIVTP